VCSKLNRHVQMKVAEGGMNNLDEVLTLALSLTYILLSRSNHSIKYILMSHVSRKINMTHRFYYFPFSLYLRPLRDSPSSLKFRVSSSPMPFMAKKSLVISMQAIAEYSKIICLLRANY